MTEPNDWHWWEWLVVLLLLALVGGLMLVASDHLREPAGVFDQGDQP